MWLNCNNSLVALDKVCFVQFAEENDVPTAMIYFTGRSKPLTVHAESMEELISYFHVHTIQGKEYDTTKGSS